MNKRLYTLIVTLLVAVLTISPVYAGGVSVKIGLGSITADVTAWGFGSDVTIELEGAGLPWVLCGTPGNQNQAPGQNPSRVSASDSDTDASDPNKVKGKFTVNLAADVDLTDYTATELGCPNNSWVPTIFFVFWDTATVTITSNKTGRILYQQTSACTTEYTGPNLTPSTLDDGTISCPGFPG